MMYSLCRKRKLSESIIPCGNEASLKCTKCPRIFTTTAGLTVHEKFCEKMREIQLCKECNIQFSDRSGLLKHLRRRHPGEVNLKNVATFREHEEVVKLKHKDVVTVSMSDNVAEKNGRYEQENVGINGSLVALSCPICPVTFSSSTSLERHISKRHSGYENGLSETGSFKCAKCPRIFTKKTGLNVHEKFCEKTRQVQLCKECNIQFSDKSGLLRHLRRRHYEEINVKNGGIVRQHDEDFKLKHKDVMSNPVSNQTKKDSSEMATDTDNFTTVKAEADVDSKSEGESVSCNYNQLIEKNKDIDNNQENSGSENPDSSVVSDDTKIGSNNVTVLGPGVSECEVCKRSFKTLPALISHKKIHDVKNTCKICDEVFVGGPAWKRHQKMHTSREKNFCHICGKSFESKSGYDRHMRKHRGVSYSCDICKKSFTASHTLKEHMMRHTNERAHVCEICGRRYNWQAHLRRHRKTHTGERNHKCEICHKSFIDKSALNGHRNTHFGVKSHSCNLCNKKFMTATVLKVHKRTHSLKRDFKCNICEREFTQSHSFKSHKKLHEFRSPVRKLALLTKPTLFCDKCPKGFVTKRGLVRHQQKHTTGILKGHNTYIKREDVNVDLEAPQENNKASGSLLSNPEPLTVVNKETDLSALRNLDSKTNSYNHLLSSHEESAGNGLKAWKSIQFSNPRPVQSDKTAMVKMERNCQNSHYNNIFDAKINSYKVTQSGNDMILTKDTPGDTFISDVDDDDDDTIIGDNDMYMRNNEFIPDMGLVSKELDQGKRNVAEDNQSSTYNVTAMTYGSAFQAVDQGRRIADVDNENSKYRVKPDTYGCTFRGVDQDPIDVNKDNEISSHNNKTNTNDFEEDDDSDCEVQCMRCGETFYSPVLLMKHLKQKCVRRH